MTRGQMDFIECTAHNILGLTFLAFGTTMWQSFGAFLVVISMIGRRLANLRMDAEAVK